jgi:photosystem II stability/assembly factor-like uncharacterized protein
VNASGPATVDFKAIEFFDLCNGFAGGDLNLARTMDGGDNWTLTTFPHVRIEALALSGSLGFAVGNAGLSGFVMARTLNGGFTWIPVSGLSLPLRDVKILTGLKIVAVGDRIYFSGNGGASFFDVGVLGATLHAVSFADSATGTAVGNNGKVFRTINGGMSWFEQSFSTSFQFRDVIQITPQQAVAVGNGGVIFSTMNGGANWSMNTSGTTDDLRSVTKAGVGLMALGVNGTILKNTGGLAWTKLQQGVRDEIRGVAIAPGDPTSALAVTGAGKILSPSDDDPPAAWVTKLDVPGTVLNDVTFLSTNKAFAVGTSSFGTIDAGDTWFGLGLAADVANGVARVSETSAVVVGGSEVYLTEDSGISWTEVLNVPTQSNWSKAAFADQSCGVVVGQGGQIYGTEDGGHNWTEAPSGTTQNLTDVDMKPDGSGAAVGENGTVITTADCGESWDSAPFFYNGRLNTVACGDGPSFTVCGDAGAVFTTQNFGETYVADVTGADRDINAADIEGFVRGLVAGDGGAILEYLSGGALSGGGSPCGTTAAPEALAARPALHLEPARPNPVAGVTTLRFSLPSTSRATLRVYDATGRLVETVLEANLVAGDHAVNWNAARRSNGIYFAVLETEGIRETQKVVVLR